MLASRGSSENSVKSGSVELASVGGQVDRVGMGGESRRPEQRRMGGPEPPRARGVRRAAHGRGCGAPKLLVGRAHAVERANELERLGRSEVAGQALRLPGVRRPVGSAGVEVPDHDRVPAVPGEPQAAPAGVEQAPVRRRGRGHGRALDRLRCEVHPEVGLVPQLPEAHARQVVRVAVDDRVRGRVVAAAVTGGDRLDELAERRGRRLPLAEVPRARLAAAGSPQRRRSGQREVDGDAVGVRVANDLVVDAPVRGRVGRGKGRIEAGRALRRRDRVPAERDAHDAGTELPHRLKGRAGPVSIRASSWNIPSWFVCASARAGRGSSARPAATAATDIVILIRLISCIAEDKTDRRGGSCAPRPPGLA